MSRVDAIRQRLEQAFQPRHLEIRDDSARHAGHAGAASGGGHFIVTIVAEDFAGQSQVARHRMVYQALSDMMPEEIHALGITAMTPDEQQGDPAA